MKISETGLLTPSVSRYESTDLWHVVDPTGVSLSPLMSKGAADAWCDMFNNFDRIKDERNEAVELLTDAVHDIALACSQARIGLPDGARKISAFLARLEEPK